MTGKKSMSKSRKLKSYKEKQIQKEKDRERMSKVNSLKAQEEKDFQNNRNKEKMMRRRALQRPEDKKLQNIREKERLFVHRSLKTREDRELIRIKEKESKAKARITRNNLKTCVDRIKKFKAAVRYGPIFPCISCEQMMFEKGVSKLDDKILDELEAICSKTDKTLLTRVFKEKMNDERFKVSFGTSSYVCHTCKKYLSRGKIPPMSAANNLSLKEIPNELLLTELENNLIARKILFQKIFQLPKSRMASLKDKIVNVPIEEADVTKTLDLLPRTPTKGGLIEVKLKRKKKYKNYHRQEYIDVNKLYKALNFLKESGNPHYQNCVSVNNYRSYCQQNDPDGYNIFFDDEPESDSKKTVRQKGVCFVSFVSDENEDIEDILEKNDYLKMLQSETNENEEIEYRTYDPIRKFQIDYDKSVGLAEKFPEAFEEDKQLAVAPGEGKIPENILTSEHWDAQAFPMKHPDGCNNLHQKRDVKLTDQYYFVQRLRNLDPRFREDTSYLFAAAAYLEKKTMQKNINVSYLRGTKSMSNSGQNVYSLKDGFSVFDCISNTPTYWKKAKYEMMAKLDNHGAFQLFFTLSCADKLWPENVTSVLEAKNVKIKYEFDDAGDEVTLIGVDKDSQTNWIPLEQYVEEEMDVSLHEILRRNVVTATRNYNHRVKSFIKEIMMDSSNPMSVQHYSAKLEFQGRGAAHNHGVLWLNLDKLEFMFEKLEADKSSNPIEYNLIDLENLFKERESVYMNNVKDALRICVNTVHPKTYENSTAFDQAKELLISFFEDKLESQHEDYDMVLSRFKFIGLSQAFKKFQNQEELLDYEEKAVTNFAEKFTSVSLCPSVVGEKVVNLVKKVNKHRHTKACRKYGTDCRFSFPKFPIWKTAIMNSSSLDMEKEGSKFKKILSDVRKLLNDEEAISKIMMKYDKDSETKEEYISNREKRVKELLSLAGYETEEDWNMYIRAISSLKNGHSLILARDIDEIHVNSYNPEWISAWNGNIDLQVCLDYFAIITYITEYFTKDDTGTMEIIIEALKNSENPTLKEKMILMMNTFMTHRQIGEAEAVYKIFPDFHFKDSSMTTVFIPNCPREERSKFLMKVDEDAQYSHLPKVQIEGRDGNFIERYDILSKYERREGLDNLTAAQFAKMYESSWKKPTKSKREINEVKNETNKFNYVMLKDKDIQGELLPETLKLTNPYPNEPPYMRRRRFPAALRFHKLNKSTEIEKYFFSECLLYTPYRKEDEIWKKLKGNIILLESDIRAIKSQVMEHLESAEEARLFVEEALKTHEIGVSMDPEGEQDRLDCEIDGIMLHPDFEHLNPEDMDLQAEKVSYEKQFRPIEMDTMEDLLRKTRNLDFYQRQVIEKGIRYSRDLVKSLKTKNKCPDPCSTIVLGGAGSGKSTVINILKQWIHLVLKKEGDDPSLPYVIVTAPTGTAASNVRGQTLHSAFGFNFGNKHYSLSDKKRDEIRSLLINLQVVIIDEISMIKSDMLYQLDLRLREVTQKRNKLFGGLSIFLFGDIMQLRPCQGSFIFDEPTCKDYLHAYLCQTHWHSFDVLLLEENHRQGEDHEYAEILNRIRVGIHNDTDLDLLRTRVRPDGHPDLHGAMYVACTNSTVLKMNEIRLKELKTQLYEVEAKNIHPTIKNFKPKVESKGTVGGTAFLQTLRLKIGSRVMLIHNIDVLDGLSNGSRGELIAVEKDAKGNVDRLIIKFDEEYQGAQKRSRNLRISKQYPGCTSIEKFLFSYSIAKKTAVASNTAQLYQFPVVVCFAATTHKFQGGTIVKPNKLAVDVRTVFDDAMAYVMFSRVQALEQLFIVGDLPEQKIRTSEKCLTELTRLIEKSVNRNPPIWEREDLDSIKVSFLNCHSLKDKFQDIKCDKMLRFSDAMCFGETWMPDDEYHPELQLSGYNLNLNSYGDARGKGLAVYFKPHMFDIEKSTKLQTVQITKLTSTHLDIIVVYRSKTDTAARGIIPTLLSPNKSAMVLGDFNVCYKQQGNHSLVQMFQNLGFEQFVEEPTHIDGGLIDQVYYRQGAIPYEVSVVLTSPFYTSMDHDCLCVTAKKRME